MVECGNTAEMRDWAIYSTTCSKAYTVKGEYDMAKTTRRSAVNLTMSVEELTADLMQSRRWLSRKPQTVYDLVKQIHEPLLKMKQDSRTAVQKSATC